MSKPKMLIAEHNHPSRTNPSIRLETTRRERLRSLLTFALVLAAGGLWAFILAGVMSR